MKMFLRILMASAVWVMGITGLAQITASSTLPSNTFLQYDNIPLRMEITNTSGDTIVLSDDDKLNHVMLRVKTMNDKVVPRTDRPLLDEPWVILDGETSVRTFDLLKLFRIRTPVSFRGQQHVRVDGDIYKGPALTFGVVKGTLMDEIVRRKEDRVFSVFSMNQEGGDVLLLRVTNREQTMTLGTYFLERYLRFYPPHMKVNEEGEIGILHYVGPQQAVLCTFSPDGSRGKREYYRVSPGMPVRLHAGNQTSFIVEGGTPVSGGGDR